MEIRKSNCLPGEADEMVTPSLTHREAAVMLGGVIAKVSHFNPLRYLKGIYHQVEGAEAKVGCKAFQKWWLQEFPHKSTSVITTFGLAAVTGGETGEKQPLTGH